MEPRNGHDEGVLPRSLLGLLVLLLASCDEPAPTRDAGSTVFIAFARDFTDFRSFQRFEIDEPATPVGHPPGPSFVYINALPPDGARAFPVGTMVLKTIESGPPQEWAIHAMVKRGGGFGTSLPGWELFELRFDDAERVVIQWRGEGPPSGMGYGLRTDAGEVVELVCSDCHAASWQNDSILNVHTRLSY